MNYVKVRCTLSEIVSVHWDHGHRRPQILGIKYIRIQVLNDCTLRPKMHYYININLPFL